MSNHVHLIIRAIGENLLHDVLRDYKKFTSKALIKEIQDNPQESRKECLPAGKDRASQPIQNTRRLSVLAKR
jgi:hypothetical protein